MIMYLVSTWYQPKHTQRTHTKRIYNRDTWNIYQFQNFIMWALFQCQLKPDWVALHKSCLTDTYREGIQLGSYKAYNHIHIMLCLNVWESWNKSLHISTNSIEDAIISIVTSNHMTVQMRNIWYNVRHKNVSLFKG